MRNFYKKFEIIPKNKKLFPRIILEIRGVKSNYFNEDLDILLQEAIFMKTNYFLLTLKQRC